MWQCVGSWRLYCSCRCSRWSSGWRISSQNVWVPKLWEAIWSKTLLLCSIIKYFHSFYCALANFFISFINTYTFQNDGFHRSRLQVFQDIHILHWCPDFLTVCLISLLYLGVHISVCGEDQVRTAHSKSKANIWSSAAHYGRGTCSCPRTEVSVCCTVHTKHMSTVTVGYGSDKLKLY